MSVPSFLCPTCPKQAWYFTKSVSLRRINVPAEKGFVSKQLQRTGTGSQTNIIITLIFCITNTFWESYGYIYVTKITLYRLGEKKYHYSLSSIIKQVLPQHTSETHQMFFSILLPFMKLRYNSILFHLLKFLY